MADIPVKIYRSTIVREGTQPSNPGTVEGEVFPPVNPPGANIGHPPVTIGSPANGLSIDPTTQVLTIGLASTSATGALSSTDWNTFNNKLNLTSQITGYTVGANTALAATDNILGAFGKVQGQINARISGTIASGQVAFGTGVNTVGGDSGLQWNNSTKVFTAIGSQTFQGTTASDTAPLGSELTTTGSGTNWTGTSFATGYTHTVGSTAPLTTSTAAVSGTYYQIAYTVTGRTAGSFTIGFGGFLSGNLTATGATGPLATSTANLEIVPTTDFDGTIVLSVRSIGTSSATTTINDSGGNARIQIRATTASSNTLIGLNSGRRITTGANNSFFGRDAGRNNTTGANNSFVGVNAGLNNTTGGSNSFVGVSAGLNNTTGANNSFFGVQAGLNNTTGANNSFFGRDAGLNNTTGVLNSFVGVNAGLNNTTGANNSFFGRDAGRNNTTGANNSFVGVNAGRFLANGSTALTIANNSVFLGVDTRANADNETNQIVIGHTAIGGGSNTTTIGNSSTVSTRLPAGSLWINTTSGTNTLDVNGTARIRTINNATGNFVTTSATGVLQQRTAAQTKTDLLIDHNPDTINKQGGDGANFFHLGQGNYNSVVENFELTQSGIQWLSKKTISGGWNASAFGGGVYVAVGSSGDSSDTPIMYSSDGISFTYVGVGNGTKTCIAYGGGLFVTHGTGTSYYTSPDGINWTVRTNYPTNGAGLWASITYGNGLFVAVRGLLGGFTIQVLTSPDGINWTLRNSSIENNWTSVTFGNGLFVAVASSGTGNRVMTSPDGINWTTRTSAADNSWRSVTFGSGLFVAVASSGTGNRIMTSPDGINWTVRVNPVDNNWISVTYGDGLFVAVSNTGTLNRVMTSPDGINWTTRTTPRNEPFSSIVFGNGRFVATGPDGGSEGTFLMYSNKKYDLKHSNLTFDDGTNPHGTTAIDVGAEPSFNKGNLVAGSNVTLAGTLTNRLVGSGNVTINSNGASVRKYLNAYYNNGYSSNAYEPTIDETETVYVPLQATVFMKGDHTLTALRMHQVAGGSGVQLRFGLYSLENDGTLLLVSDLGFVTLTGLSAFELTTSVNMAVGKLYYVAIKFNNEPATVTQVIGTQGNMLGVFGIAGTDLTTSNQGLRKSSTAGTMPSTDTLPTASLSTNLKGNVLLNYKMQPTV
jgi:hypothetical protein